MISEGADIENEISSSRPDAKQIDEIRREVAKLYHQVVIDLALHGEARIGNRRFWHDEQKVVRWEDLPEEEYDVDIAPTGD
jgi:hypothetical protein